ncbi:MEDS domain-containing protein [Actinoplanes sp. NPDC023936]|uniref:MEDS domain-containing protein n=1 Tax=Actinoplanes sp. NPDC023936 TaxID=3154910 RepID=UPI0033CA4C1C
MGDHICWTVSNEAVRLESLIDVVRAGLRAGHRVLYCGDDSDRARAALRGRGLHADAAVASGDLRFAPAEPSFLTAGVFDPATALRFLRREIEDARHAGNPGLRLITDMSWASRPAPGVERLPEFEAEANTIFAEGYLLGVCAYDPRLFDPLSLRGVSRAHPGTVGADAPFDPDLVLRIRHTRQPFGLRLEGEADLLNQRALSAVLDHLLDALTDGSATATVDVSGLRFVDTAAARVLLRALDQAAGRLRITGRPPALARLLASRHAGQSPARHDRVPRSGLGGTSA